MSVIPERVSTTLSRVSICLLQSVAASVIKHSECINYSNSGISASSDGNVICILILKCISHKNVVKTLIRVKFYVLTS